jgi:hypothetical protein
MSTSLITNISTHPISLDSLNLSDATIQIPQERVRSKEGKKLFYNKEGFFVAEGEDIKHVHPYDTDKTLHGLSVKDIMKYTMHGKFRVSKFNSGEYRIESIGELNGGGPGGATIGFYVGKFLTHFVGHGVIQIAAVCSGPAYLVTLTSLEATFGPGIEAASNVVGLGTGILGGVATGSA